MRGLKRHRSARILAAGHAFVQNLRRGHCDIATDTPRRHQLRVAFDDLVITIWTSAGSRSCSGMGRGGTTQQRHPSRSRMAGAGVCVGNRPAAVTRIKRQRRDSGQGRGPRQRSGRSSHR